MYNRDCSNERPNHLPLPSWETRQIVKPRRDPMAHEKKMSARDNVRNGTQRYSTVLNGGALPSRSSPSLLVASLLYSLSFGLDPS